MDHTKALSMLDQTAFDSGLGSDEDDTSVTSSEDDTDSEEEDDLSSLEDQTQNHYPPNIGAQRTTENMRVLQDRYDADDPFLRLTPRLRVSYYPRSQTPAFRSYR